MTTTRHALALLFALLAVAPVGCNTNMSQGTLFTPRCVVYFNGKCHMSTCGAGQTYSVEHRQCECDPDRLAVDGGCLTSAEAKQYCGKGASWGAKGCEPIQCRAGDILDLETETCVSKKKIDQQAGVAPGKTLACTKGTVLTVSENRASCVPVEQSCTRDEYFNPGSRACVKLPTCSTGSVFDQAARGCKQVAQQPASNDSRTTVNVNQWAQSTYGVNGGQGASSLCGPLARKPLAFGVMPGGSVRLVIHLTLGFPGSLTDAATVTSPTTLEASGQPVAARGAQEVQATADGLLNSLRVQKAHTMDTQLDLSVKCLIVNGEAPQTVPTTGGA